jgi:hypothetical protein
MIEAARPIYAPRDSRAQDGSRTFDDVQHARLFTINTFYYARAVERAGVARLAAARRVERRAVERDGDAPRHGVVYVDDARVELREMRIVVIESFGHSRQRSITGGRRGSSLAWLKLAERRVVRQACRACGF